MFARRDLLSDKDLNKLHNASMEILKDVGIAFYEPEAIEIFSDHGVKVDGNIVYIEEQHIEKALETAPSEVKLYARNPERSVVIGGDNLMAKGATPSWMIMQISVNSYRPQKPSI